MTASPAEPAEKKIDILPYSLVVGQDDLKLALEIGYVARLGVLATGQRGTAKSTTVRAFAQLAYDGLPVTMPIGVTDDRVLGGWDVSRLLGDKPETEWQDGLLKMAHEKMLYVDEINLLDDHIVNLVLDPASTSIVTVQRENASHGPERYDFTLVGSMNPDEGPLRPQLLDRFGLVVQVRDRGDTETRAAILRTVLDYETFRGDPASDFMTAALEANSKIRARLDLAVKLFPTVGRTDEVLPACASVAAEFHAVGHRGEAAMARAAMAHAALQGRDAATLDDCRKVARFALMHRRPNVDSGTLRAWGTEEDERLDRVLAGLVRGGRGDRVAPEPAQG